MILTSSLLCGDIYLSPNPRICFYFVNWLFNVKLTVFHPSSWPEQAYKQHIHLDKKKKNKKTEKNMPLGCVSYVRLVNQDFYRKRG